MTALAADIVWGENVPDTIAELLAVWQKSLPRFTDVDLAHECERLECLPPSPMCRRMRDAADAERCRRGTDTTGQTPRCPVCGARNPFGTPCQAHRGGTA